MKACTALGPLLAILTIVGRAVPYWAPLEEFKEIQSGCQATSGLDLRLRVNASIAPLRVPQAPLASARQLLVPGQGLAALQGLATLATGLRNCTSVRGCGFFWAFMAMLFGAPTGRYFESEGRRRAWELIWEDFVTRAALMRTLQVQDKVQTSFRQTAPAASAVLRAAAAASRVGSSDGIANLQRLSPFGGPGEREPPHEAASTLLLSGHSDGFFRLPHIAPFVNQLRCYAERRGMRFVADGKEQPLRHAPLAVSGNHFWAARWPTSEEGAQVPASFEANLRSLVADLLTGQLGRASELAELEGVVSVYFDNPEKQTKVWSIARHLSNSSMVIYLDTDMTIRPDSLNEGLVRLLVKDAERSGRRPSDVYIRDAWPGIECLNSGFVAFRNTRNSRLFLEMWMQKIWWAVSWDQSALAETVLEIIGLEVQKLSGGARGYSSQCLRYLFPIANGLVPYSMYCDCWQAVLGDLIGPYRQRRSRIVSFVDPERVDVNFVPSDLFVGHTFDLAKMHLESTATRPALNPLIVHWAGIGKMRLWLTEQYLTRRFNTTMAAGTCESTENEIASFAESSQDAFDLGSFASYARQIRCCQSLRSAQLDGRSSVTADDMAYWGCCSWRPVRAAECQALVGE